MASPNTATPTEPVTDTAVIMDGVMLNINLFAMLLTVVQTEKPKISFNESLSKYFQFIFISVPRLMIMSLKYYYEPCNGIYGYKRIHSVAEVKRNNHTDYDKHLIE